MTLVRATLQPMKGAAAAQPQPDGAPIPVQLNPTSLRYQVANNVDEGKSSGRQATQANGSSSATLQFDLVFDSADEGSTDNPVDVRKKIRDLEQFVLPLKGGPPKQSPKRVKFSWGTFCVIGVMSALNQDFDLFAASGVPLRAKVSITIKEQKPELDAGLMGHGANQGQAALPMERGATPGGGRFADEDWPPKDRTGTALAGESASDFASRMGLDPAAWKSFAAKLPNTLSLPAGLRVDFSASASASLGVGLGARAAATADARTTRSRAAEPARDVTSDEAVGAGGVGKVIEGRTAESAARKAADTRAAFGAPAPSVGMARPAPAPAPTAAPSPAPSAPSATAPAPAPPPAPPPDRRASSYGLGVPLRPRVGTPSEQAAALVVHSRCGKREAS